MVPSGTDALTATWSTTSTAVPGSIEPRLQVTVPRTSIAQAPAGNPVYPVKATPAGSVSVTVTASAVDGPALLTTTLYESGAPATTGSGESVLVMPRAACDCTVTVLDAKLLALFGS